ncbi:NAD(P)-dependent oxidoreductase [Stenotrophomonas sp. NPDC087984]
MWSRPWTRGALRGAALDVMEQEPLPPDHPLWRHPSPPRRGGRTACRGAPVRGARRLAVRQLELRRGRLVRVTVKHT